MTNSIGLMLRSPPCPKGEVDVSKHVAAPSFETRSFGALLWMRRSEAFTRGAVSVGAPLRPNNIVLR
jgi:hypothetical protein